MSSFCLARGYLRRYTNDGTYHGAWTPTKETPAVGDDVVYWRCGDNRAESFRMPEVGVVVRIWHMSQKWGGQFEIGSARFEAVDHAQRFTDQTPVGDVPDSWREYRRVA